MVVVFFPFEVEYLDGSQGILGRQIPGLLAEAFRQSGVKSHCAHWLAAKNDEATHVNVGAPLPATVVEGEARKLGASEVVLGRVRVDRAEASLALALWNLSQPNEPPVEVYKESFSRDELPQRVWAASQALAETLQCPAPKASHEETVEYDVWLSKLAETDKALLLTTQSKTTQSRASAPPTSVRELPPRS